MSYVAVGLGKHYDEIETKSYLHSLNLIEMLQFTNASVSMCWNNNVIYLRLKTFAFNLIGAIGDRLVTAPMMAGAVAAAAAAIIAQRLSDFTFNFTRCSNSNLNT